MAICGPSQKSNIRAFTLIEMLIVILIIGILAAFFGQSLFGSSQDAKIKVSETQLTSQAPSSLLSLKTGSVYDALDGQDLTKAMIARGMNAKTPWGQSWTSNKIEKGEGVTVEYPLPDSMSDEDKAKFLKFVKQSADSPSSVVKSVSDSDKGIQVAYFKGKPEVTADIGMSLKLGIVDLPNAIRQWWNGSHDPKDISSIVHVLDKKGIQYTDHYVDGFGNQLSFDYQGVRYFYNIQNTTASMTLNPDNKSQQSEFKKLMDGKFHRPNNGFTSLAYGGQGGGGGMMKGWRP